MVLWCGFLFVFCSCCWGSLFFWLVGVLFWFSFFLFKNAPEEQVGPAAKGQHEKNQLDLLLCRLMSDQFSR